MTDSKERLKDIILTDFLDGRLDEQTRREVQQSIDRDPELQSFWEGVRLSAQEPFQELPSLDPPEDLWSRIKAQTVDRPALLPWWQDLWKGIQMWGARPRMTLAFANVMVVVLVAVWVQKVYWRPRQRQIRAERQVEYLMYLVDSEQNSFENEQQGFGTTIENYFL